MLYDGPAKEAGKRLRCLYLGETRAKTMTYSENYIPSRQLQTVKTVAYSQGSYRLLRQLQTVRTVANCKTGILCPHNIKNKSVI